MEIKAHEGGGVGGQISIMGAAAGLVARRGVGCSQMERFMHSETEGALEQKSRREEVRQGGGWGRKTANRGEERVGGGGQLHVFSGPLLTDGTFQAALRHGLPASSGLLETRCRFLHGRSSCSLARHSCRPPVVVARVSERLDQWCVNDHLLTATPHGKLFNATSQERLDCRVISSC